MGQKIGKTAVGGKENKPNRLHRSIPPLRGHRQAITALLHPNREISLIDPDKTKIGYEIPFNRHFYVFEPPRPLAEIDRELNGIAERIKGMIEGMTG